MYVSSELRTLVIIKMLLLCFMKQIVTERLLGGANLMPLCSWYKIEELVSFRNGGTYPQTYTLSYPGYALPSYLILLAMFNALVVL
jgi:hypothetical protein